MACRRNCRGRWRGLHFCWSHHVMSRLGPHKGARAQGDKRGLRHLKLAPTTGGSCLLTHHSQTEGRREPVTRTLRWERRKRSCRKLDEIKADRLHDCNSPTRGSELSYRILDMIIDRIVANLQDHSDIPGRFSFRSPLQNLSFARGELDLRHVLFRRLCDLCKCNVKLPCQSAEVAHSMDRIDIIEARCKRNHRNSP